MALVVGSNTSGAIAPTLVPFTDTSVADAFQDEYGGETFEFAT